MSWRDFNIRVSELLGKRLSSLMRDGNDELLFFCDDGSYYRMYHEQSCCESVTIEDICGDLQDLVGTPILQAEEVVSREDPEGAEIGEERESFTWTFYKFATIKGSVTIRWYGESNGYYSERVDFEKVANEHTVPPEIGVIDGVRFIETPEGE